MFFLFVCLFFSSDFSSRISGLQDSYYVRVVKTMLRKVQLHPDKNGYFAQVS